MMRCREILDRLEERWNPSFALSWDNVGLLVGKEEKEIGKIFVALDVTEETLEQAVEAGADLMITHHPLLFSPVKKVTSGDFIGRRLIKMIQNDLCYYAMHTNFDVKGMAQLNENLSWTFKFPRFGGYRGRCQRKRGRDWKSGMAGKENDTGSFCEKSERGFSDSRCESLRRTGTSGGTGRSKQRFGKKYDRRGISAGRRMFW